MNRSPAAERLPGFLWEGRACCGNLAGMDEVTNNRAPDGRSGRYELVVDGETAFCEYRIEGGRIIFPHTVVPRVLEGRGVGSRLVKAALADARAQGLEIVAECSFVAAVLKREARAM
jgi:predicted GNAT family acetyltransferase